MRKYAGREYLTRYRIPILDCLWNDVLFLFAVNPKEIIDALVAAGGTPFIKMSCYKIDAEFIDPKKAVIYLHIYEDGIDGANERNFVSYKPQEAVKLSVMPESTKDYYVEMLGRGKWPPLVFHKIPHILYKGTFDVSQSEIVVETYDRNRALR